MGSGSGTALGIIGIILAAGAIGFAFFVWNGQNTTNSDLNSDLDDVTDALNNLTDEFNNLTDEFNNLTGEFNNFTRTIVVGIWDALVDNLDYAPYNLQYYWLFEFGDNQYNDTDYISVANTNTRITLLKSGWYRIHLTTLLGLLNHGSTYNIAVLKDGTNILRDFHTASNTEHWHKVDLSAFVYSNGTNYFEINAYSTGSSDFNTNYDNRFNQLTIEYVVV